MGYHVAVVRTRKDASGIKANEIEPVLASLGYAPDRDEAGKIKHFSREVANEEVVLFYDADELWAKNPSEIVMEELIRIARLLGRGARVRGDEGETYRTLDETYLHPDDVAYRAKSRFDWKYWISFAPPVIGGSLLLYALGRMAFRYFYGR